MFLRKCLKFNLNINKFYYIFYFMIDWGQASDYEDKTVENGNFIWINWELFERDSKINNLIFPLK